MYDDSIATIDKEIYDGLLFPRHGPGKTADRRIGNAKYFDTRWTERLEELFPHQEYAVPSPLFIKEEGNRELLSPRNELPVQVTFVPKTTGKVRTIAMEPTHMMYMQQALMASLYREIDKGLSGQFVRLRDATYNQDLARIGSIDGSLATIDLSDASDLVSNQLVRALFDKSLCAKALDSTRSRQAALFDKTFRLSKFASMGSATCFPIETMVFVSIALAGCILEERDTGRGPLRYSRNRWRAEIKALTGRVSCYGDDIIVPTTSAPRVVALLEEFNFKVNARKSFWNGSFRESCGKEWFNGVDVTIARLRAPIPQSRRDASEIVSLANYRNQLYERGLWNAAKAIDLAMPHFLDGLWPLIDHNLSRLIGRHSFLVIGRNRSNPFYVFPKEQFDPDYLRPFVKGKMIIADLPKTEIDGEFALLHFFLHRRENPLIEGWLHHGGRSRCVKLITGWASAG